ncbi:MAG: aquaporin, partial [Ignavibacteria bacterium]|nr:aquaporin [Ignavibacteria bacterium]
MNKYLTEFIGAFFLILVIGMTGNPLAIGAILMVMIYMGGNISGGHYNPAVTLGVFMRGKIDAKDMIMYWVFQLLGAIIAAFIVFVLSAKTMQVVPAVGRDVIKVLLC